MATFNSSTGAVTVGTTSITPLADGSNLDETYANLIDTAIQANTPNFPKSLQRIGLNGRMNPNPDGTPTTLNSIITDTTKLPGVIMITIQDPSTKILAYVDQSGNSSYIVKVDPLNMSKLVPGGVQVVASRSPTVSSATSQSSGTPWWIWLLIACVCLLMIGGGIMFAMKK